MCSTVFSKINAAPEDDRSGVRNVTVTTHQEGT